jgi:hypothetical protein
MVEDKVADDLQRISCGRPNWYLWDSLNIRNHN